MKRITNFIKANRVLFKNFTSLSILQLLNYIFPLITLPYVVRVLGVENYGLVQFAIGIISIFHLFVDYGFDIKGTKDISLIKNEPKRFAKKFFTILSVKTILFVITSAIIGILLISLSVFQSDVELFLVVFSGVVGTVLFPSWFFYGVLQTKYITYIHLFSKSIYTVLIFVLVVNKDDYLIYAMLNSFVYIFIGVTGLVIALKKFELKIYIPSTNEIKNQLFESWYLFQSSFTLKIFNISTVILLGLFTTKENVGYFVAADKVRLAFQGIQSVISLTIFPYLIYQLKESFDKFRKSIKKYAVLQISIGFISSTFIFLSSFEIIELAFGAQFEIASTILKIIAFLPLFGAISNVFGNMIMIPLDYEREFSVIFLLIMILKVILLVLFIPEYGIIGASVTVLLAEFLIAAMFTFFISRKGLFIRIWH